MKTKVKSRVSDPAIALTALVILLGAAWVDVRGLRIRLELTMRQRAGSGASGKSSIDQQTPLRAVALTLRQKNCATNLNTCRGKGATRILQLNLPSDPARMALNASMGDLAFDNPQQNTSIGSVPVNIVLEYAEFYYRQHGKFFVIDMHKGSKFEPIIQCNIDFVPEEKTGNYPGRHISSVENFVDSYDRQYLDWDVVGLFKDIPELRKPALGLQGKGIGLVGSLVQMKKSRLLDYPFITEEVLSIMEDRLDRFGFKFEMNLPWWSRTRESLKQQALFRGL